MAKVKAMIAAYAKLKVPAFAGATNKALNDALHVANLEVKESDAALPVYAENPDGSRADTGSSFLNGTQAVANISCRLLPVFNGKPWGSGWNCDFYVSEFPDDNDSAKSFNARRELKKLIAAGADDASIAAKAKELL